MIWGDLLSPRQITAGARPLLNRDTIVNYWNYWLHNDYAEAERFIADGFDVWVSPWNFSDALILLLRNGYRYHAAAALGTTWNELYHLGAAFVDVAEHSWNHALERMPYDSRMVFYKHYAPAPDFAPAAVAQLRFSGGVPLPAQSGTSIGRFTIDCSAPRTGAACRIVELEIPDEITALAAENPRSCVFLKTALVENDVLRIDAVNAPRGHGQLVLYTPSHGRTTRTNLYGYDFSVAHGKLLFQTSGQANSIIPPDGALITHHATGEIRSDWLWNNSVVGERFVLYAALPDAAVELPVKITAPTASGTRGVVLILEEQWHVFTGKVDAPAIAEVVIRFTDGTEKIQPLRCDLFLQPDPALTAGFQAWPLEETGTGRRLALLFEAPDAREIAGVELRITEIGLQQQLTLCGGISYPAASEREDAAN